MREIKYGQIAERLREERLRLGIAQVDFAEACAVSRNALMQWERGEATPNAAGLAVMAGLGVDVLYVVTGQRAGEAESTLAPAERELLQAWRDGGETSRAALGAVAAALKQVPKE
ncbi:helix-turn-helix domain-containing protein [Comamonas sp. 17RB]|uniref:helix-turn-helix domain-containing protein n=1 Tax=Comamonas sp. 17RB TaxID=3047025 RepID=UPI0024B7B564|nr:helix-turn-helix domain-containing protein [Comamonas sp. 17RB]MDI9855218.1 helix-turn-helix domain-containing protein [Comamonas sp. 17RB]